MSAVAPVVHAHTVAGRTVYRYSQTLDDVCVVVPDLPPGAPARAYDVRIEPAHLTLGLVGNPPYLDVRRRRADGSGRGARCGGRGGDGGARART
jgi:hypothetical protein